MNRQEFATKLHTIEICASQLATASVEDYQLMQDKIKKTIEELMLMFDLFFCENTETDGGWIIPNDSELGKKLWEIHNEKL